MPKEGLSFAVAEGSSTLENGDILLGSDEAAMMRREKLIAGIGSELVGAFGPKKVRIVGVLQKTGTIMDDLHIVNDATFAELASVGRMQIVDDLGLTKIFLFVDDTQTLPKAIREPLQNAQLETDATGRTSIAIGSREARMMKRLGLIKGEGSTVDGLFGANIRVEKILPATKTMLDEVHIIPASLTLVAPVL